MGSPDSRCQAMPPKTSLVRRRPSVTLECSEGAGPALRSTQILQPQIMVLLEWRRVGVERGDHAHRAEGPTSVDR